MKRSVCAKSGKLPEPLHPGRGAELTAASQTGARNVCLSRMNWETIDAMSPLSADDRRLLSHRLRWDDVDIDGHMTADLYRMAYDAYRALEAMWIGLAAANRDHDQDNGDERQAAKYDARRHDLGREFIALDRHDRDTVVGTLIGWLREYAVDSRLLYEHELHLEPGMSSEERMRIITGKPSLPVLRDLFAVSWRSNIKLVKALHRNWPWAADLDQMPAGWKVRFGAELLDDMQTVIGLGLTGFKLDQVKEKYGGLRVYFDDDAWDALAREERSAEWLDLAGLMHSLIAMYESLSTCTCVDCGAQDDIRRPRTGWILPLCERCYLSRHVNDGHAEMLATTRAFDDWEELIGQQDDTPLADWVRDNVRGCDDPRLADLHIRKLIRLRDAESGVAAGDDDQRATGSVAVPIPLAVTDAAMPNHATTDRSPAVSEQKETAMTDDHRDDHAWKPRADWRTRAERCPLLAQVMENQLVPDRVIRRIVDHPLFAQVRSHFFTPMEGLGQCDHCDHLDDFRYELSPAWMIALSDRFGGRYLSPNQRMQLLAHADASAWEGVFAVAAKRYASPHISGGTKMFGCNQEYAYLLRAAARLLDCGGPELLQGFLTMFRLAPAVGCQMSIGRSSCELMW
ncbi:hypothetical protein [Bifidobacterium ramosum]|nr:hypothetical protein [Bifidobacterium ramosum]NEG71821.1 hypothetical protein [Bifidobacterium ramosum]